MKLSNKTKKSIESIVGLSFREIIKMDSTKEKEYVENKTGKKTSWREGIRVEARPIRTMEIVDNRIDIITRSNEER